VLEDVLDEKMTVAYVEKTYGVVIDPQTLRLDEGRTAALRRARGAHTRGAGNGGQGAAVNGEVHDAPRQSSDTTPKHGPRPGKPADET